MTSPDRNVDPASGEPLWRAVTRRIRDRLERDGMLPGDRLPTETELARDLGVNRHTVRRALKYLEDAGELEARQGRGRFVRLPAIHYHLDERTRFSSILTGQQIRPATRLLRMEVIRAPDLVADALSLRGGSKVIHIERLGIADDTPVSLASHWLVHGRFPDFCTVYERHGSITRTLRACGLDDYIRQTTRITARLATAREREVLGLPRHVPLLVTRSVNVDARGWAIEYGEARMASDRIELDVVNRPGPH